MANTQYAFGLLINDVTKVEFPGASPILSTGTPPTAILNTAGSNINLVTSGGTANSIMIDNSNFQDVATVGAGDFLTAGSDDMVVFFNKNVSTDPTNMSFDTGAASPFEIDLGIIKTFLDQTAPLIATNDAPTLILEYNDNPAVGEAYFSAVGTMILA